MVDQARRRDIRPRRPARQRRVLGFGLAAASSDAADATAAACWSSRLSRASGGSPNVRGSAFALRRAGSNSGIFSCRRCDRRLLRRVSVGSLPRAAAERTSG